MNNYIENHEEIRKLGETCDIGVALDKFENAHKLEHDELSRAQYIEQYCPGNLSFDQRRLLHPVQDDDEG